MLTEYDWGVQTQSEERDPVKHPDKVIRRQQTESARLTVAPLGLI